MKIKKLLLITAVIFTSGSLLGTSEVEAQGLRRTIRGYSNRGLSTRVYSYPANRGSVYSNRIPSYSPFNNYSSRYGNYGAYSHPSRYGYSNNYRNGPRVGFSFGFGNSGFGGYRSYGY